MSRENMGVSSALCVNGVYHHGENVGERIINVLASRLPLARLINGSSLGRRRLYQSVLAARHCFDFARSIFKYEIANHRRAPINL